MWEVGMKGVYVYRGPKVLTGRPTHEIHPVYGEVYTIREIMCKPRLSFRLVEIVNAVDVYSYDGVIIHTEITFHATSFRRVQDIKIIQGLLTQQPIEELVCSEFS